MIIYYRDEEIKQNLQKRHPNVKANWVQTDFKGEDSEIPIICRTGDDGKEHCEAGEKFIEQFAQEEGQL